MTQYPLIALVDDDDAVRLSLASLMRSLGYRVAVFASAEAFLAEVEAIGPAALITDMQMPGISGLELLARMNQRGLAAPSIVMTAFPSDAMRAACLAQGALAYLPKPTDADTIARILEAELGAPE